MLASASAKFNEVIFLFTYSDEGELWVRALPSVWKIYFTLVIKPKALMQLLFLKIHEVNFIKITENLR